MDEQDRLRSVDLGIPGWDVTYDPDGRIFTAVRREKLTSYNHGPHARRPGKPTPKLSPGRMAFSAGAHGRTEGR